MRPLSLAPYLCAFLLPGLLACESEQLGRLKGQLSAPEAHDFGRVSLGLEYQAEFKLQNTGSAGLSISQIEVGSGAGAEYIRVENYPRDIAPGQNGPLLIVYAPRRAELLATKLIIHTNILGQEKLEIILSGESVSDSLEIDPNPLDFGPVRIGEQAEAEVLVINRLSQPLVLRAQQNGRSEALIQNTSGDGYFQLLTPLGEGGLLNEGKPLQPAEGLKLKFSYVPQSASSGRLDQAKLGIYYCDDSLCKDEIRLSAKGIDQALLCSPAALNLGQVSPGGRASGFISCENVSRAEVEVHELSWLGTPIAAFTRSHVELPARLQPQDKFLLRVALSPDESLEGQQLSTSIRIKSRDLATQRAYGAIDVTASGRVVRTQLEAFPARLNFGRVLVGQDSPLTIALVNVGQVSARIKQVSTEGPFSANLTPQIVLPGSELAVPVTFTPTSTGAVQGLLRVQLEGADMPDKEVLLSGTGLVLPPCNYQVEPERIDFGLVQSHRMRSRTYNIRNVGVSDCLIRDPTISGSGVDSFSADMPNGPDMLLKPSQTASMMVRYHPTREGEHRARLSVTISNPRRPLASVELTGVSSQPKLLIMPSALDFGSLQPGCASRQRTLSLYNNSATTVIINQFNLPGRGFEVLGLPTGLPSPPGQGLTLAPGASIHLETRFLPNAVGVYQSRMAIGTNADSAPQYVEVTGRGDNLSMEVERFEQRPTRKVDVLFVIDNSTSMAGEQMALSANSRRLIEFMQTARLDFHLSVISTDMNGAGQACIHPVGARPMGSDQGACGYFADGGVSGANANWRIVNPLTLPSPREAFLHLTEIGTSGSAEEQGLEALLRSFMPPISTGWNAGFIRQDAHLGIVFISDEDDQSSGTIAYYTAALSSLKGSRRRDLISVSGVVADPEGCQIQHGIATRYISVIDNLSGEYRSICTPDWAGVIDSLAQIATGVRESFQLDGDPLPGSIVVSVDGIPVPEVSRSGTVLWTYDAVQRRIRFMGNSIPRPRSIIEIGYQPRCF